MQEVVVEAQGMARKKYPRRRTAGQAQGGARRAFLCETPLLSMEQGGRSAAITHLSDEVHVRRQPL